VAPGEAVIDTTWAYEHSYLLLAIAVACAVIGVLVAWLVYLKKRLQPWEPRLFADGWNYDRAVSWFMGHPGRAGFQATADFDAKVVDGAVNGAALAVKEAASGASKGQTGYVRQYAGVIGIGVIV